MQSNKHGLAAESTINNIRSISNAYERTEIVDLIRQWGGPATDALLDPSCKIFNTPGIRGFIGYRLEFNTILVYGDPVCAPQDIPVLTQAFSTFCKESALNFIFIIASESFTRWAYENHFCRSLLQISEKLVIDPFHDPRGKEGVYASLVRRKVRHALHEGTVVKEYLIQDKNIENLIDQAAQTWLKARQGPQIHISNVYLFSDRQGKRWFYAQQGSRIVGVCVLNQLQCHNGWLLNHLMSTPDAPGGTPELLVVSALETLRAEDCHFVTFGTIPANSIGEIRGISPFSSWLTCNLYQLIKLVFRLNGHHKFWKKFHPVSNPTYLLFSGQSIKIRQILAIMRSMNVSL